MTSSFDAATAVTPQGDGRYGMDIHPEWSIGGRTNGGYLLAAATRAVLAELAAGDDPDDGGDGGGEGRHPVAVTGAFAAPAPAGPARIDVEVLRRGRTTSVARARVVADGADCVEVVVTAGPLAAGEPLVAGPRPPVLPERDALVRLPDRGPSFEVPIMRHVDIRLDPATLGWAMGVPSGEGELRGLVELADGRPVDPLALVLVVDALPPATFDVPGLVMGWVPTMQLSAFVRAVPGPGPLTVVHRARSIGAGAVDETTDVWDATGRLVAVGHQLAAVRLA